MLQISWDFSTLPIEHNITHYGEKNQAKKLVEIYPKKKYKNF